MSMVLLATVPTGLLGLLVVALAVAVSVGLLYLIRHRVPVEVLEANNEVAGVVYAVVGVVYAVVLGFVVITVWEQFDAAETNVEREANALGTLFRDAGAFAPETRAAMREALTAYARVVVDEEWPAMARQDSSQRATDALTALWHTYESADPRTPVETAFYAESIRRLNDVGDYRRLRLLEARSSLPSILWVLLVAGGFFTVAFTYFFGLKNTRAQMLMTMVIAATVAFAIFLVLALDNPFLGDVSVKPVAFEMLLRNWPELMAS